ncbi:MAG: P1 family peptidase [Pseudomonadota bacterium]
MTTVLSPGARNAITDITGLSVGQAEDHRLITGVTVVLAEEPVTAAVAVSGGGPGTRGTTILDPASVMTKVDAIVLSGGSAFGLDAPGGAVDVLRRRGRGFAMGPVRVPIVPGAILFDLLTGDPAAAWEGPLWWHLARRATDAALDAGGAEIALGAVGAGLGARAGGLKGGVGSASVEAPGMTVAALTAANPLGEVIIPGSRAFWAHPWELDGEFGAVAPPAAPGITDFDFEAFTAGQNTTLAVVATDLALDRTQCLRVAVMAQDGFARAIRPVHSPLDGDTVFVLATGARPTTDPIAQTARAGMLAADCVARSIARGVYEAESVAGLPAWRDLGEDGLLSDAR